ncbi:ABC transporter permease, partial [Leucobacter sp. M11]|uniref:ABC transporter permease n=1 Tax=Leucobacter sp. M11 TaxID=2993565 RepID=UPI002D7EB49B
AVPGYARLARAATLAVRSAEHVTAARVLGFGPVRVFLGHVLPVTLRPVVALGAVGVGTVMLGAASLSFLGLGAQPPAPDWGMMLSESRSFASRAWWLVVFPGLALALVVGSVTVLGRAARERMR